MAFPSEYPEGAAHKWRQLTDADDLKLWRNGEGDVVIFTQTFNEVTDYWELTDTTGEVVTGKSCGPFEEYLEALAYVNTFLPTLGREELPEDSGGYSPDEVKSIGSYPGSATDRECAECEEAVFAPYRVEYGDESHEWLCPPCANTRFGWETTRESPVGFDVNGTGVEGADAIEAVETILEGHARALINAGITDENSMVTALQCLHRYKFEAKRDADDDSPAHTFFHRVLRMMTDYREEYPEVSWYEIRDALDELQQFAHEYALEERGETQGRKELLREIEESDLTPNEWYAQNVDGDAEDA